MCSPYEVEYIKAVLKIENPSYNVIKLQGSTQMVGYLALLVMRLHLGLRWCFRRKVGF